MHLLLVASGQAVRRLTLDQEIVGSNPTSPAKVLFSKLYLESSSVIGYRKWYDRTPHNKRRSHGRLLLCGKKLTD
jgi:hypothetical protein